MKYIFKRDSKEVFYKRGLFISFSFFMLSLLLFHSEVFRGLEDYIFSCYNQNHFEKITLGAIETDTKKATLTEKNIQEKKKNRSQVVIVKKDMQSAKLFQMLHKSSDRSMFANLVNFLGSDKQIKFPKNKNVKNFKFFTMDIGLFKNIKDLPIVTSIGKWNGAEFKENYKPDFQNNYDSQSNLIAGSQKIKDWFNKTNNEGICSFIRIKEDLWSPKGDNVFKRFSTGSYLEIDPLSYQDDTYKPYESGNYQPSQLTYLILPTLSVNWQDEGLKKAIKEYSQTAKNNQKYIVDKKYKSIFKLLWQWTNFIVNASIMNIKPVFEFPKYNGKFDSEKGYINDVTLMRFSLAFSTEINKDYVIPAASVIGIDFLLDVDNKNDETVSSMDLSLMEALKNSKSNIVLASYAKNEGIASGVEFLDNIDDKGKTLSVRDGSIINLGKLRSFYSNKVELINPAKKFLMDTNSKTYEKVSRAAINVTKRNKSYVSSVPLYITYGGEKNLDNIIPSFGLKIAMLALDERAKRENKKLTKPYLQAMNDELERIRKLKVENKEIDYVKINDLEIPVDSEGNMYIDFVAIINDEALKIDYLADEEKKKYDVSQTTLPSYSLYECVGSEALKATDELSENELEEINKDTRLDYKNISARVLGKESWLFDRKGRDKNGLGSIVLFGPFELTDMDFYPTPLTFQTSFRGLNQDNMMGVEVHANAIINIMDSLYLKPPKFTNKSIITLFFACLILGLLLEIVTPTMGFFIMFGMSYYAIYHGYVSYIVERQILYVTPYLFAFPLIWSCSTLLNYIQESVKAQTTKAMFSRFVSADVVKYILDNPNAVKPGGEKAELTVFFSDVAGFTTISEKLSPEELVVLLNEYLGAMTDIVFKYGGTLDKFIGDAVMAFWNYPRKQEDHCLRACLCALEMQRKIDELQIDWAKRGLPKVAARCGINSAEVVVGYMGSIKAQMNFTCMGDGVNLASRLEGANKEYGTKMMISEAVYLKVQEKITCRFLDFLAVKGKKEPVKVYELVSEKGNEPENWSELVGMYDEAIRLHLEREWDKAIGLFDEILEKFPNDGPSITYKARCEEYKNHPPPEDWDGRYILTHK